MKKYIVAINIDKVQTFLYYVIHAHTQEKQSNSGTLRSIIDASDLISKDFYKSIIEKFEMQQQDKEDILLQCSGVFIFSTDLLEDEIRKKCSALFLEYYKNYNGQLLMKYVYFESAAVPKENKEIKAIEEGKKRLKQSECLKKIIEEHKDIVFRFQDVRNISRNREWKREEMEVFASDIDQLFQEEIYQNDNHFRIAVIKADLDNMGELFKQRKDYSSYKKVSDILTEFICIEKLKKYVKEIQERDEKFRLYPFYMAGDDIFFAVSAHYLMKGIDICKRILKDINQKIQEEVHDIPDAVQLSMSIGIEFTFNREPILYYYERVEQQLETAKKEKKSLITEKNEKSEEKEETKKEISNIQLSINHYVFFQYDKLEEDKPNWEHFIHSIKVLKNAIEKGFKAHHFLYGLLRKITDPQILENKLKYSNVVLYHLSPQYLNSSDKNLREAELLLIETLLKQVSIKTENQYDLNFDVEQRKRLEGYVRLLLLFSDSNLKMTEQIKTLDENTFEPKRIRSSIFNRVLRYLYTNNLETKNTTEKGEKKLRDIFIKKEEYNNNLEDKKGKQIGIKIYRTLRISPSMFYRIKNRIDKENNMTYQTDIYEDICNMIQAVNRTEEEIQQIEDLHKKEHKAPPSLYFDKEKFHEIINRKSFSKDYIDSLLIFYQFNQQSIEYKVMYPSKNTTI